MKYSPHKTLIISCLIFICSACSSAKNTNTKVKQEKEQEERQEAFDELYNQYH